MFALEPPLEPYYNEWKDYVLPKLCKLRLEDICENILKKGDKTIYQKIYDTIYELVEEEIEYEHFNEFNEY